MTKWYRTADTNGNAVVILLGNGDGTFQTPLSYPAGLSPDAVAVGDLNGDGLLDVAVNHRTGLTLESYSEWGRVDWEIR